MDAGYAYKVTQGNAHTLVAELEGSPLQLTENLGLHWELEHSAADTLSVLTHRDPAPVAPQADEKSPAPASAEPGFFEATLLIGAPPANAAKAKARARTVVMLFDTSLSMQWDKLERSYAAAAGVLQTLRPGDRFNLLLFNDRVAGAGQR